MSITDGDVCHKVPSESLCANVGLPPLRAQELLRDMQSIGSLQDDAKLSLVPDDGSIPEWAMRTPEDDAIVLTSTSSWA